MTTNDAAAAAYPYPFASAAAAPPASVAPVTEVPLSRPMPRLGRGIVWSDIVAEIERDNQERLRDAA